MPRLLEWTTPIWPENLSLSSQLQTKRANSIFGLKIPSDCLHAGHLWASLNQINTFENMWPGYEPENVRALLFSVLNLEATEGYLGLIEGSLFGGGGFGG